MRWYEVYIKGENDVLATVDTKMRVRAETASKAVVAARRVWIDENCRAGAKGLTFHARLQHEEE